MAGLCILCLLWALAVTALYIGQKRHIKKLNEDVREILEKNGRHRILLKAPDKEIEKLLETLNHYIEDCQKREVEFRTKDTEFKHQISNISHDLRTPLTSILGYVQLVRKEYEAGNSAHVKEYLDIIERKAELLKNLISQFYDLSRLEGNEYEFQIEAVDLSILISQTVADYYDEFERRNFEVETDIEQGRILALCDAKASLRIFGNLIQNVLKHGFGFMSIRMYHQGKYIVTEIANKSEAIEPQELAHLFDRFFTTDRMRSGQNTGLGLAIVRQFVTQMGGDIEASYENGLLKMTVKLKAA